MRAVVQRVESSEVLVDNRVVGKIGRGLTVLLGIEEGDTMDDVKYMAEKIVNLRIFEDAEGKMNLSLMDNGFDMLAISQFTLMGDCRKGRRPNFMYAAKSDDAVELYEGFIEYCRNMGVYVQTGVFQAHMLVKINNDGPVTVLVDSKKVF